MSKVDMPASTGIANHSNLAFGKGDLHGAIAEYRAAIRFKKDYAEAHCNLGHTLRDQGQFAEALEELRRGHDFGSKDPRLPQWVKDCERLVEVDAKLPRVLKGEGQPADFGDRLALAQLCQLPCRSLHAAAVRFYAEAFAAQPQLADDLQSHSRYNAACAAALAGCGQGKDADKLNPKERAGLRKQALDWLRADLKAYRQMIDTSSDKAGAEIAQRLQHWLQDTDFSGVRGAVLAKLPETERAEWRKLWADVENMLANARARSAPKEKAVKKDQP
jgi:tetratricopeptide (TPR) repeat protein